jgi:hypothetical protein
LRCAAFICCSMFVISAYGAAGGMPDERCGGDDPLERTPPVIPSASDMAGMLR